MARHLATLAAVAGLLLLPSSANALSSGRTVLSFQLPASNGYTLHVKTERGQTLVSLWNANRTVETTYFVHDSVAGTAIDADLGPLGQIDVDFEPSGREVFVSPPGRRARATGCRIRRRLGTFAGAIAFYGENGYTAVEATSVPGSIGPSPRGRCDGASATASEAAPVPARRQVERVWTISDAILMSRSSSSPQAGTGATLLLASAERQAAYFLAYRIETPGPQITISRRAEVATSRSSFSYRRSLRSALIQPPAPFGGQATYSARRGRLSGDLTVEFPGLPPQSLTGPRFEAQMRPLR